MVRPAADGVFAAFKRHPLVGIGDRHGLAEEGEFYVQLLRDPGFSADVRASLLTAADATQVSPGVRA